MQILLLLNLIAVFAGTAYSTTTGRLATTELVQDPGLVGRTVNGSLVLRQYNDGAVSVTGTICGLIPNALHGFHVHDKGVITPNCMAAGGHFNPYGVNHGAPWDVVRHVGDLGNVRADENGVAQVSILDKVISLEGPHSIMNRAFVLHALQDDLGKGGNEGSLKTGNAGDRWACGLIKEYPLPPLQPYP